MTQVQMVCIGPLRLKGGTWWRKKSSIRTWHGKRSIQLGIKHINRRIFEDGFHRKIGKDADNGSDPESLVRSRLKQCLFGCLIFTGGVRCLRKGGECLGVVVFLAIDIGLCEQILVIRRAICGSADRGKLALRFVLPALFTSLIATGVSWVALPDAPTYNIPSFPLSVSVVLWVIVCSPIFTFGAILYVRLVRWADRNKPRGLQRFIAPAIALGLVGVVSAWFPDIL